MSETLTASEAIFGFMAWMTTRGEVLKIGASCDAAPFPPLIDTFCKANGLIEPRENWTDFLTHPPDDPTAPTGDGGHGRNAPSNLGR